MRKRPPSGEERELFEETFRDAKPLKGHARPKAKRDSKPPSPQEAAGPVAAPQRPQAKSRHEGPTGLDGRTAERLRKGLLEPEARLDLHGLTETNAHRALVTFVKGAHARGLRLVLVVTGKGANVDVSGEPFSMGLNDRLRGVLKTMTPRWLGERDLVSLVADIRTAHRRHGGDGALYVYLRKNPR